MAPRTALPAAVTHRMRRMHPATIPARRALTRIAVADADAIRTYQDRHLRRVVRLAAQRSPHYRAEFARIGVDPREIRGAADLSALPLLDRDVLAAAPDRFRTRPARTMWPARSSGTTGIPVTAYRTPASSAFELAALERQWSWFGVPRRARSLVLRGRDFAADSPGAVTRPDGPDRMLLSSFHLTAAGLPEIDTCVRRFRPRVVEGWPSSLHLLARLLAEHGRRLPVQAVITSSEVITGAQRRLFAEVFAGPVIDHYGQVERVALAGTCEAGGYHVFADYGIVELLPVPGADDRYEIVGTPLHNRGFPLLRYRTGDQVGPAPSGPCPCGRALPRLGRIHGRVEDVFRAADGRALPLPSVVVDDLPGVHVAQIAQLAPGRFEIRMRPGVGFDAGTAIRTARRNVDRCFGGGQQLSIRVVDRLPGPEGGKLRPAVREDGAPSSGARVDCSSEVR